MIECTYVVIIVVVEASEKPSKSQRDEAALYSILH